MGNKQEEIKMTTSDKQSEFHVLELNLVGWLSRIGILNHIEESQGETKE